MKPRFFILQLNTGRIIDLNRDNVNLVLNTLINAMGVRKAGGERLDDFGDASLAKGVVTGALVSRPARLFKRDVPR